jgi:FkbM family methyltransferase
MITNFVNYITQNNYDTQKQCIIFDIGSRDCQQAIEFYNKFPNAKIYAFECNANTIPLCLKNIEQYSDRITFIPKAIHSYTGKCKFFPINQKKTITSWNDGNPGASSLFKSNGSYTIEHYIQDEVEVDCVTLSDIIEEYSIPKVDIIWIDLQGAELLAFHSMKEHISNVDFIHTEISHTAMYTGQAMFSDIHAFLTPNFTLINNISRTGWQEDGIYMNVKLN